MIDYSKVLFVGMGRSVVSWYRAALPALYLGADWVGVDDFCQKACGVNRRVWPSWEEYDIIVWQQPRLPDHRAMVQKLRAMGKIVLIDCDDYLHGVRKMVDHDFRNAPGFSKKALSQFERTLANCDGLIASTEFIRRKYGKLTPRSWVCMNGLDLGRYDKSRPKHSTVNIGWAGATGHALSFGAVRAAIDHGMSKYDNTTFISIGQDFAGQWAQYGNRILSLPWCSLEVYPNAMTLFDISLAPARESGWYRGKSALRYYEAAALGIPTIGSSVVYSEIEHGVTGMIADTPQEWIDSLTFMIENSEAREEMGRNALRRSIDQFDMNVRVEQWRDVIDEVYSTLILKDTNVDTMEVSLS